MHPLNSLSIHYSTISTRSERDCHLATTTVNKSKNNGQPVFIQHREPMLPAVDPDKRIVSPGTRRNDTEARYTLKVIFRHESSSSSSSLVGDPMDVREMDGEHRSKDAKHLQEFVVRRVEPIIEWGEKQISHALSLQVDKLTHTPYQYSPAHSRTTPSFPQKKQKKKTPPPALSCHRC